MTGRVLLAAGESLGQYTVELLLGPGRHTITYRAHDAAGDTCVLKLVTSRDEAVREAWRRAAAEGTSLRHGHLVGVRGLVEADGLLAVVTDYVDGPSLRRWLAAYEPTPDEVLTLFGGVLRGLDHLHAAGFLHRGLHPGNVLLGPAGNGLCTRVSDWGVYRPPSSLGISSARYLAPEVLAGGPGDERADLWALGCLLYELSTGRPPFDAEDIGGLLDVVQARPAGLDPGDRRLPPAVAHAIGQLLRPDPKQRLASTDALHEALYGDTIVRRIQASRSAGEEAEERGTAFASEVGLALARALGPGEGRGGLEVQARPEKSVEHVARRVFTSPAPKPEPARDPRVPIGLALGALGLALIAVGAWILTH